MPEKQATTDLARKSSIGHWGTSRSDDLERRLYLSPCDDRVR